MRKKIEILQEWSSKFRRKNRNFIRKVTQILGKCDKRNCAFKNVKLQHVNPCFKNS